MSTRRSFIRSGAAMSLVGSLLTSEIAAQSPTAYEPISKIGDTRDVFDSEYGTGREEGDWVIYGEDDPSTAYYYVLFNSEGIAETAESDFRHLETGGLPIDGNVGESRFVPPDAEALIPLTTVSDYRATDGWYNVASWHSPELASATGRSGNVIVMDGINYFGPDLSNQFTHTMVSMETFEVNEMVPNGEFMGAHTPVEEWEAYSGETYGMFALTFENGPVEGLWTITHRSASVEFEDPISVADANNLAASMAPVGEIVWTTFIPPSPMGEEGIRAHGIQSELGTTVTAQWVIDGEDSGSVTKIYTGFQPQDAAIWNA